MSTAIPGWSKSISNFFNPISYKSDRNWIFCIKKWKNTSIKVINYKIWNTISLKSIHIKNSSSASTDIQFHSRNGYVAIQHISTYANCQNSASINPYDMFAEALSGQFYFEFLLEPDHICDKKPYSLSMAIPGCSKSISNFFNPISYRNW